MRNIAGVQLSCSPPCRRWYGVDRRSKVGRYQLEQTAKLMMEVMRLNAKLVKGLRECRARGGPPRIRRLVFRRIFRKLWASFVACLLVCCLFSLDLPASLPASRLLVALCVASLPHMCVLQQCLPCSIVVLPTTAASWQRSPFGSVHVLDVSWLMMVIFLCSTPSQYHRQNSLGFSTCLPTYSLGTPLCFVRLVTNGRFLLLPCTHRVLVCALTTAAYLSPGWGQQPRLLVTGM